MTTDLHRFDEEDFCYLTTTGRVTGRPHTIEIWFALHNSTLFMLSDGGTRADWVKNIQRTPQVTVRIAGVNFVGRARIVESAEEDALARRLLLRKYQPRYRGDLTGWGRTALPVAVDLAV
jgi:deazaflavin-dependent oxidoreductase (nitroreductase family)